MKKKTKFFLFVLIIFLILVLFFSIFKQEKERKRNEEEIGLNLPNGVNIIEKDNLEIENNYSFNINKEETKNIELHNNILSIYEKDIFLPSYSFFVLDNKDELSLVNWLKEYNFNNNLLYFDQKEKKEFNNYEVYKIKVEGDPEHYNYYIDGKNFKIYIFSTALPDAFENVLNTFKVLKNN